jgi:PPE family/PE family
MAYLDIDPDAVVGIGSRVAASASTPAPVSTVPAPAQDPVSVGVAATLSARLSAITAYSAAAGAIVGGRAQMLQASASDYRHQEQANTASLGPGGAPAAAAPSAPIAVIARLPPASIPPPSIGAPPGGARAISELIHSGRGAAGLYTAAQHMRHHAAQLAATADQLRAAASMLTHDWDSRAGYQAAGRVTELGDWHDRHAQHATAAAAAVEQQGGNFGRARAAIPTPDRFDDLQRRLRSAIAANQTPGSFGRYAPVISQLQAEIGQLNSETVARYGDYLSGAADPSVVGDPLQPPPRPGGDGGTPGSRDARNDTGIQLVDFKQAPKIPSPYPDGPGSEPPLGLPAYDGGTLSAAETRTVYVHGELRMRQLNDELIRRGVSTEERARIMFEQRNALRDWSRQLMSDRALADQLSANEPNLTFDDLIAKSQARGLTGQAVYEAIIDSSTHSRSSVNESLGIDPENPPPLPAVRTPPAMTTGPPPAADAPPHESGWGTYVPPEKLIESDNPVLRIIGEMLIGEQGPPTA